MLVIESFQSDERKIIEDALEAGQISERDTVWAADSGQTVVDDAYGPDDDVGGEEFMDIGSVKEYLAADA